MRGIRLGTTSHQNSGSAVEKVLEEMLGVSISSEQQANVIADLPDDARGAVLEKLTPFIDQEGKRVKKECLCDLVCVLALRVLQMSAVGSARGEQGSNSC